MNSVNVSLYGMISSLPLSLFLGLFLSVVAKSKTIDIKQFVRGFFFIVIAILLLLVFFYLLDITKRSSTPSKYYENNKEITTAHTGQRLISKNGHNDSAWELFLPI